MPNMISERATAYRAALRQGLNDGLSIKAATDLAQKAARDTGNTPQQDPNIVMEDFGFGPKPCIKQPKPVELTDAELRRIDESELTADECDRLDELDQAAAITELERERDAANEEEAVAEGFCCSNCGIPHAIHGDECGQDHGPGVLKGVYNRHEATLKSDAVKEMAEALGYRVIQLKLVSEDLGGCPEDTMTDALGNFDANEPSMHEFNAELCNCEFGGCGSECKGLWVNRVDTGENDPVDAGDFGAGTRGEQPTLSSLADAWRDAVGIVTPAGLRMTAKANFMTGLCDEIDAMKEAQDPNHKPDEECCDCGDCDDPDRDPETGAYNICADEQMNALLADKPRDCDIPATLRAVEIHRSEDHGTLREWFDGDAEMHQFLCALKLSLYAEPGGLIKDQDGDVRGMWFYAHFGPTPIS